MKTYSIKKDNKHTATLINMGDRGYAIEEAVNTLIEAQKPYFKSVDNEFKTAFVNSIGTVEQGCDVVLICHNKTGNSVARKYSIPA